MLSTRIIGAASRDPPAINILRGGIWNRTHGTLKNLPGIYLSIFTNNIWSYLLCMAPRNSIMLYPCRRTPSVINQYTQLTPIDCASSPNHDVVVAAINRLFFVNFPLWNSQEGFLFSFPVLLLLLALKPFVAAAHRHPSKRANESK